MMYKYHLTCISSNAKTGPIPVSTASHSTCPEICPLKGDGCYAESGPLMIHWKAVSEDRGYDLDQFCSEIRQLPKGQLWRYGQAGDLPGDGHNIDSAELAKLAAANKGRKGFAFTHYEPTGDNADAIKSAVAEGFMVNLSANNLEHADELADLGVAPVVTLLPADQTKPLKTPQGRLVAICPAVTTKGMTCARCGICAKPRKAIIGFPAHGTGKRKAAAVFHASKLRVSNVT